MFDNLSHKLTNIFDGLKKRGSLRGEDVDQALRDIRLALLEADVALPAVKEFINDVRTKAVGQEVINSVSPAQQVIKIVNDALVLMLDDKALDEAGGDKSALPNSGLSLNQYGLSIILMVGLQGSGKTTTTAKIAHRLAKKDNKKLLMASLDVHRPAAQEQLKQLGERNEIATLPIVAGQSPIDIAKRAKKAAEIGGYDVVILDSAGRLSIDEALMNEIATIQAQTNPQETLLVADALTGQDAAKTAQGFHDRLNLSGIVLTRIDGDSRGGAALSMRHVTGAPIKFIGVGEAVEALEIFDAKRIAWRILGMGDIVALVEKASETIEQDEAEKMAKRMQKGQFDLNDMASQLRQMKTMGGAGAVLNLLPSMGKMMGQVDESKLDSKNFARQEAIISSMTKQERRHPDILQASRKKRIASGAGVSLSEVNKLLKQHGMMAKMMKQMKKGGGGMMGALTKMMGVGGSPAGGPDMAGMPNLNSIAGGGMLPGMMPGLGGGANSSTKPVKKRKNNRKRKKRR